MSDALPPVPSTAIMSSWMQHALKLASRAAEAGDVPIGAIILDEHHRVIGEGFNTREASGDPTAHAEVNAIRAAAVGDWRLNRATLVVTLEPCAMCAGAIWLARIPRVIFGAWEPKTGAAGSVFDVLREPRLNHTSEVIPGVLADECANLLTEFFVQRR